MNRYSGIVSALLLFVAASVFAHETVVTPLLQVPLTDLPDREGLMVVVDFPPGDTGAVHRHNAHTFVYVLEGSVEMQVEGGEKVLLQPGDTFYETPDDIHVVGRNASETKAAKILVFFVKRLNAPATVPVP